jgi:preprotein translocase subunit YajC
MNAVRQLQGALQENDEVMTTSGMFGRVARLGDDDLDLEIAPGVTIRMARGAISQRVLPDDPQDDLEAN